MKSPLSVVYLCIVALVCCASTGCSSRAKHPASHAQQQPSEIQAEPSSSLTIKDLNVEHYLADCDGRMPGYKPVGGTTRLVIDAYVYNNTEEALYVLVQLNDDGPAAEEFSYQEGMGMEEFYVTPGIWQHIRAERSADSPTARPAYVVFLSLHKDPRACADWSEFATQRLPIKYKSFESGVREDRDTEREGDEATCDP